MRLTEFQINSIKEIFLEQFPKGDHIWLFGSRVYPEKKGGDIDLYIETSLRDVGEIIDAKIRLSTKLKFKIGDQKIDIVVNSQAIQLPIYEVARKEGILLI